MEALFGAVMRRFKVRLAPLITSFTDSTRLQIAVVFCYLK